MFHCINDHNAVIPDCVAIKQRVQKFTVPSSIHFTLLYTRKMFDSKYYEFLLPNYKIYEQKDKSNYKKTYQIEYTKNWKD